LGTNGRWRKVIPISRTPLKVAIFLISHEGRPRAEWRRNRSLQKARWKNTVERFAKKKSGAAKRPPKSRVEKDSQAVCLEKSHEAVHAPSGVVERPPKSRVGKLPSGFLK
jgi:hypothetical protein